MRFVRKDYNKSNRCPAWSGSGIHEYGWEKKLNEQVDCRGGSSGHYKDLSRFHKNTDGTSGWKPSSRLWNPADWNFHRCEECGTITLPYVARFIDPEYWLHVKLYNLKMNTNYKLHKISIMRKEIVTDLLYEVRYFLKKSRSR